MEQQSKGQGTAVPSTPGRRKTKTNPMMSPTGQPRSPARRAPGNTGIAQAKSLVQAILIQITMDDSPPVNDFIITKNASEGTDGTNGKGASPKRSKVIQPDNGGGLNSSNSFSSIAINSKSSQNYSRQQHIHVLPTIHSPTPYRHNGSNREAPSPTAAVLGDSLPFLPSPSFANSHISKDSSHMSSFSFDRTSLPISVSIETPRNEILPDPPPLAVNRLGKGAEIVMGNLTLAALCVRTIESVADDVADMVHIQRQDSVLYTNSEIEDSTSSWRRDIEMAPTFTNDDLKEEHLRAKANEIGKKHGQGSIRRKDFLSDLDTEDVNHGNDGQSSDDYPLFPDAKMSEDDVQRLHDAMNPIVEEEDDDDLDNIPGIIPAPSKEDGVLLSAVAEENEDDDGYLNNTFEATNVCEQLNSSSAQHIHQGESHMAAANNMHSPDSAGNNTKLTLSPEQKSQRPRMQMFGSEYARHLSSESPFSPVVHKSKSRTFPKRKAMKNKRNSSAVAQSLVAPISPNSAGTSTGSLLSVANSQSDSQKYAYGPQGGHSNPSNRSDSTMSTPSLSSSGTARVNLEEASAEILSAAITDIVVTHGTEKPPKGYYAISQTSSGIEMDTLKSMTKGGIGKRKTSGVFLNVKKEPKWERAVQRPCVTALAVIFPEQNEFVPPGFCVVRRYKAKTGQDKKGSKTKNSKEDKSILEEDVGASSSSYPANLNYGTSGERVYLCYRRSREGNPITGMIPLQPSNNEAVPEGYTVLERSPRNYVADINSKAGPSIFLAFRQRLANLETLRPLPLVLSVLHSNKLKSLRSKGKKRARLRAYYCTGGTLVPSEVGKYHIMDRSTHPLISPSSVTNRLSLIQAARTKNSSTSVNEEKHGKENNRSDRSPSPVTLANGLIADTVPQPALESPSSGLSLQYSSSLLSEDKSDGGGDGDGGDGEIDSIVSETASQPQKESLVDNILHLVSQISPKYGKKVEDEEKAKSLLVGDMVSGAQRTSLDKPEKYGDGLSVASSASSNIFGLRNEADLESCFEAMAFIPLVESPVNTLGKVEKMSMETLLQARTAVLTPILTACYTHHGGSSLLAVEGLTKLLSETDFFLPDVAQYEDPNTNQRLTLLDLSIQVVCDMANSSARETNFLPCIEFVVEATHYSRGNLNDRTIGYIMRFYLFVFYFGASVPTVSSWPKNKTSGYSRKEGLDEANDTLLLSEDELDDNGEGRRRGYVPGGAPQAAALAMKELITLFLSRLRKMKSGGRRRMDESNGSLLDVDDFMKDYVNSLVDGAMHQVDVSNYAQLALHQIHRSGGSELFWHDMMTSCGSGLFGSDTGTMPAAKNFYITSFAILSSIVKVTSGKVRRLTQSSESVPRDISSKLLSLELMHHFLHQWGKMCKYNHALQNKANKEGWKLKESVSVSTMAYTIRRLMIPCLLSNTRAGLDDIKVFRRMMRIVTELWCNPLLRRHIKIEIGVLIEHFVLKLLRLGPQVLPPKRLSKTSSTTLNEMSVSLLPQQVCIVTEMKTWFLSEPRDILELFMNFDQVDAQASKTQFSLLPSTHWKITQQMCGALCTLAEQCTDIVSDQIRLTRIDLSGVDSQSAGANQSLHHTENDLREMTLVREGARYLQEKCFDTVAQIVRSLMLCAAASSGANYNLLSKLREKQEHDNAKKRADIYTTADKEAIVAADDDSSKDSDGSMTVKSVSTIGNIVGGIMKKKRGNVLPPEGMKVPESPRNLRQVPQLTLGDDDGDGIVEYWQTSIASERRKNFQPSPKDSQDISNLQKKPPRKVRPNHKSITASPARLSTSGNFRGSSPISGRSPRRDDVSIVSFADESARGDPHLSQKFEETLNTAFEIMKAKSLKKALEYLNACNILTSSPRDIATFLRLYQTRIDTSVLGDYLGEGGKDGDEVEHYNLIRFHYTAAISFVGMNVEQG